MNARAETALFAALALGAIAGTTACDRKEKGDVPVAANPTPAESVPAASAALAIPPRVPNSAEEKLLAENKDFLVRKGDTLTLRLKNGTTKDFGDRREGVEEFVETTVREVYRAVPAVRLSHLVHEGGSQQLVSLVDGSAAMFVADPVWAPDRRHFASANADESSFTPDQVVIGRCDAKGCAILHEEEEVAANGATWSGNGKVTFELVKFVDDAWKKSGEKVCRIAASGVKCDPPPTAR